MAPGLLPIWAWQAITLRLLLFLLSHLASNIVRTCPLSMPDMLMPFYSFRSRLHPSVDENTAYHTALATSQLNSSAIRWQHRGPSPGAHQLIYGRHKVLLMVKQSDRFPPRFYPPREKPLGYSMCLPAGGFLSHACHSTSRLDGEAPGYATRHDSTVYWSTGMSMMQVLRKTGARLKRRRRSLDRQHHSSQEADVSAVYLLLSVGISS